MLQNPSNLYSGGNVVLDAMPYVRMAMAARERKAAREEAVDKYYQNLPNTINDKGVRDQEVPIISDIKNQMMETYLKNRDAIKRGDPAAQLELSKLARQGLSVARNSQNASANDIKVGVMAQKKENLPILTSPYFIEKHQKSLLPVTDPNYEPLNMADILAQRPFDENEYRKIIKSNYKYSEGVPIVAPHPTDKSLNVVTTNPILDKPTKEQMYADAAEQYHSNPTFEKKIHDLGANPETLNRLNEVSKATFGKEIEEPEDIAAAYTASLLPSMTTKAIVKPSIDYANAEKEKLQREREAYGLEKQRRGELGKDKRLKAMLDGVQVTDVLGKAEQNANPKMDIPLDLALKGVTTLIPVSGMDEREKNDVFGKPDKYGERPIKGINVNGKEYIAKTGEGKYKAAPVEGTELSTIDPQSVLTSTWTREKELKKSIQSGKVKEPTINKPAPNKNPLGLKF